MFKKEKLDDEDILRFMGDNLDTEIERTEQFMFLYKSNVALEQLLVNTIISHQALLHFVSEKYGIDQRRFNELKEEVKKNPSMKEMIEAHKRKLNDFIEMEKAINSELEILKAGMNDE